MKRSLIFIGMAVAAVTVAQANTAGLRHGQTSVTLSEGFINAMESLNVDVRAVGLGKLAASGGKITATFPISDGQIDLKTAKAEILHSGGLQLKAGNTVVILNNYAIDTTGATPALTGIVRADGTLVGRIKLFDLQLPKGLSLPLKAPADGNFRLSGVGVTLSSEAANALNGVFKVQAFKKGFEIGHAQVSSRVQ